MHSVQGCSWEISNAHAYYTFSQHVSHHGRFAWICCWHILQWIYTEKWRNCILHFFAGRVWLYIESSALKNFVIKQSLTVWTRCVQRMHDFLLTSFLPMLTFNILGRRIPLGDFIVSAPTYQRISQQQIQADLGYLSDHNETCLACMLQGYPGHIPLRVISKHN